MTRVTLENLSQFLLNGETDTVEFKRTIPTQLKNVDRVVSAFANTKGGSIIFGYDEQKREIVGVLETQIQKLKSRLEEKPYRGICSLYTILVNDKLLAIVDVQKTKNDFCINNTAYIRNGDRIYIKTGDIRSKYLKEFIEEIQYRNRNPQNVKALELLDDLSTNPERTVAQGTFLYRCRIINNMKSVEGIAPYYGYGEKDSFVPPINATRDMRANYRYIPYLYCASHPYTALVEVRPRLGSDVSMARIRANRDLVLLDFTINSIPKRISDAKLNLLSDLSMLFSKPIASDDDILDYIPTQYIAEFSKKLGYDGIAFRSSLTPELDMEMNNMSETLKHDRYNVVVFNYSKCVPVASNIIHVTRNYLECE